MYEAPKELDDWLLLQAAKWAGVPPWELREKPAVWLLSILEVMNIENTLQQDAAQNAARRQPKE